MEARRSAWGPAALVALLMACSLVLFSGCGAVPEYLIVTFEPATGFTAGGQCPSEAGGEPAAADVGVLIEGECQGRVGETLQLTEGSYEVSVDVVGAETRVVELEQTTREEPMEVVIRIGG